MFASFSIRFPTTYAMLPQFQDYHDARSLIVFPLHRKKIRLIASNIKPPKTTKPRRTIISLAQFLPAYGNVMSCATLGGRRTQYGWANRALEFLLRLNLTRGLATLCCLLFGEFGIAFALFWCLRLVGSAMMLLRRGGKRAGDLPL